VERGATCIRTVKILTKEEALFDYRGRTGRSVKLLSFLHLEPKLRKYELAQHSAPEQVHIYIQIIYSPNIYNVCSGFIYCERNVYFTKISRTEVTDDFFRKFLTICPKREAACNTVTAQVVL
jgi:hypothetical protein